MKTVKVFIASSEELIHERNAFSDLILQLNDLFERRELQIKLIRWEHLDPSMGPMHKQEEYNEKLKTCEMCLVLYWTKFGEYTQSELETAYTELCAGRNPRKLYIYFKDETDITPELRAFKENFASVYGHFFCRFENVDTLRLNFLLQFENYHNTTEQSSMLKIRNSKVEVDGQPFADLRQIPFAGKNPDYLQMLEDIEKKQAHVLKHPDDSDLRQELYDLQQRREKMEQSLLDTAKRIVRLSSTIASARLSEAMHLFEQGDNRGANAILNMNEIASDARANVRRIDHGRELATMATEALEINIEECSLKINTIQNGMATGWVAEVIAVYAEAVAIARNYITPEKFAGLLGEYADFLRDSKQYHLVGNLYDECLVIRRTLAKKNPEAFEPDVARTLNSLAVLHTYTQQYDSGEIEYQEALQIYRKLADKSPEAFKTEMTTTLSNLASLHYHKKQYDLAIKEFQEVLWIYRGLKEKSSETYKIMMAVTLNNFAMLHADLQQYNSAEEEFKEALSILCKLAVKHPEALKYVAETLYNLGTIHINRKLYTLAKKEHSKVLQIYRKLSDKTPETFEPLLADSQFSFAVLYMATNKLSLAKASLCEALEIYERYANHNLNCQRKAKLTKKILDKLLKILLRAQNARSR